MSLRIRDGVTLYFCRHGETVANIELLFQGRTIDTPLTDKGRAQAQAIGHSLVRECPAPAPLAYVASPLQRARTTMEIIRTTAGLPRDGYTTEARIQEINLGAWDGLTDAQAKALDPAMYEKRMHNKGEIRVPGGGENYEDVAKRLTSWVGDLDRDTFAVSHGAATRILRGLFQGLSWEQMSGTDEKQGVLFRVRGNTIERFDPPGDLFKPFRPASAGINAMANFRDHALYVIRHGECEHNVAGRAAAQNNSPLTANGRSQARANGVLLKEVAGDLSAFDFFASSLHRTCNTMEIVREAGGLPPTGYLADRRLMEIDFGDHTWMTREEIMRHPVPNPENSDWDFVRPGGESLRHVYDRVGRFLNTLTGDSVIVTHYGPAWMIHTHYLGIAPGGVAQWRPPHAGIMRLSGGTETFFGE